MKKITTFVKDEPILALGLGVLTFLGVRYALQLRNEQKSNASGNARVPCTNPTSMVSYGNAKDPCCTGTKNCRGTVRFSRPSAMKVMRRRR